MPIDQLRYHISSKRTICEVHREIYDVLVTINNNESKVTEVIKLLEEAFEMAKKIKDEVE